MQSFLRRAKQGVLQKLNEGFRALVEDRAPGLMGQLYSAVSIASDLRVLADCQYRILDDNRMELSLKNADKFTDATFSTLTRLCEAGLKLWWKRHLLSSQDLSLTRLEFTHLQKLAPKKVIFHMEEASREDVLFELRREGTRSVECVSSVFSEQGLLCAKIHMVFTLTQQKYLNSPSI